MSTDASTSDQPQVLSGLRVVDFTWVMSGPYATRLLADYGAEVIKIQSLAQSQGRPQRATGYFNLWSRNKQGISLNLGKPEGVDLLKRLVGISDVVVENFSARVMANWGLDYPKLAQIKPDIIMVSMAGFGHTGPWAQNVSYGPTIQALSGMTHLMSHPGDPPTGFGYSYSDHVGGINCILAVLEALRFRERTGEGQHVDLSQFDASCALLGPAILDRTVNGRSPQPQGNRSSQSPAAPHSVYRCRGDDRWVAIAVSTEDEWRSLCQAMGDPEWCRQERFATLRSRLQHQDELDALVEGWTSERTPTEVMHHLQEAGVPAGALQDGDDLYKRDPQLRERGFFVQAEHPELGMTTMDNNPIHLSETPSRIRRAAPTMGQDNAYVFGDLLGLSGEEIERLVEQQVIY